MLGVSDTMFTLLKPMKWFFNLMALLLNDLFRVKDRLRGQNIERSSVLGATAAANTPAIVVILASAPRVFLRFTCRYVRNVLDQKQTGARLTGANLRSWSDFLVSLANNSPIEVLRFERVLEEVNYHAREAYSELDEASRTLLERHFLISGQMPEVLVPVVQRLLTITLDRLSQPSESNGRGINMALVKTTDTRWLGLTDDSMTVRWQQTHRIDVLRKTELDEGLKRFRKCTRCGSCMEDSIPHKYMHSWLKNMGKNCICRNPWMLVER